MESNNSQEHFSVELHFVVKISFVFFMKSLIPPQYGFIYDLIDIINSRINKKFNFIKHKLNISLNIKKNN